MSLRPSAQSPATSPANAQAQQGVRVLLVEDCEYDAALVLRELERGGYAPTCVRVETREAFVSSLEAQSWDVIISDHALPRYDGFAALEDLHATGKDIPFILISGSIGEAVAVRAMKAGAQDYVLKGDLTRLPVAVEREIREAAGRAEQTKMRERLVTSERMASAGTLAAGVAHEINNPLAIAVVNLDVIATSLKQTVAQAANLKALGSRGAAELIQPLKDLEDPLRDALEGLGRIRDIVRDVKLFSRSDDAIMGPVDIRRVADSSARMAWNEIRHRARLVKEYGEVPFVHGNESRLGQVLLNLLANAAQSMPDGHADGNEIRVTTKTAPDGRAILEVTDTGSGIPDDVLSRIFDPFFTTKPIGFGTGLGLSICHRIVSELGGRIEVESRLGRGATFRLLLPAARESPAGPTRATSPLRTGARGRVLIVDDEAPLARALGRSLSADHDAIVLTSGHQALAALERGDRFDAVIMDLMMPEMTGMEVYSRVERVDPDQARRIIFLTGGAFTAGAREFLDRIPNHVVEKPVRIANLKALIAALGAR
ncbi:MAG: response regulator [Polyangiaceae bacterium]